MFKLENVLFISCFMSSIAFAATNQTFQGVANQGTYYSENHPCALKVSKMSASQTLIVEFTENPVFWFPGNDTYVDVGKWQEANLCPLRHRQFQFYCAPGLNFCQESGVSFEGGTSKRTVQLDDAGDLVEANFGADYEQQITSVLRLYTNTQQSSVACIEKQHATQALAVLDDFAQNILDQPNGGCLRTISDADTGMTYSYYSAECVERHLLPIYVNNLDGYFVEKDIASLSSIYSNERGTHCLKEMSIDGHVSRLANIQCTRAELDLSKASLQSMLNEAAPYCTPQ